MRRRGACWVVAVVVAGCGRIGYDDGVAGGDAPIGPDASAACRADPAYLPIEGLPHTYRASDADDTWPVAVADCRGEGAYLMIIDSDSERTAVPGDWLGITDEATEGAWLTVRGDPAPFLLWDVAEPDGGRLENCARLDEPTWLFVDRDCNELHNWTCECE